MIHIDFSVLDDCLNLYESYGEICVHCNCCGRFDDKAKYQDRVDMYKRQLQENAEFNNWCEGLEELQKKNIALNAESLGESLREAEKELEENS